MAMPWPWDWSPEAISAAATCVTAAVALLAAIVAYRQWSDVRESRREQTQPYVLVNIEPTKASAIHLDLVIKNVGATIAKDVTFEFHPPLRSTFDKTDGGLLREAPIFKRGIPTLPPGVEHRIMFADGPDLKNNPDMPMSYDVVTRYRDTSGHSYELPYRLDAEVFYDYSSFSIYGDHDAAKALMEIEKTVKKWTAHFNGLRVWARDEDAYVQREREEMQRRRDEQRQRELEAERKRDLGQLEDDGGGHAPP